MNLLVLGLLASFPMRLGSENMLAIGFSPAPKGLFESIAFLTDSSPDFKAVFVGSFSSPWSL